MFTITIEISFRMIVKSHQTPANRVTRKVTKRLNPSVHGPEPVQLIYRQRQQKKRIQNHR